MASRVLTVDDDASPRLRLSLGSGAGGGVAPADSQYLVLALDSGLSGERRFVAGAGLSATDAGANGDYTLALNPILVPLLTDPGADRIAFWDDSDGAYDFLAPSAPISISGNNLQIAQSGAAADGYLSSTDWNTFNNKQSAHSVTANYVLYSGGAGVISGEAAFSYNPSTDQLALSTSGSGAGLLIGGDAQIYRRAADVLATPDRFESGGGLVVGGNTLPTISGNASTFAIHSDADAVLTAALIAHGDGLTRQVRLTMGRSFGTEAAPEDVDEAAVIGHYGFSAYYNGAYRAIGGIGGVVTGTPTSGDIPPSRMTFSTSDGNGASPLGSNRMHISPNGLINASSSSVADFSPTHATDETGTILASRDIETKRNLYVVGDASVDSQLSVGRVQDSNFTGFIWGGDGTPSSISHAAHLGVSGSGGVQWAFSNDTTGHDMTSGFLVGLDSSEQPILFSWESTAMKFSTNGTERLALAGAAGGESVFNDPSADIDFRVESDGNTHAIFVDAGNNRVGIFTSAPSVAFDVTGAAAFSSTIAGGGNLTISNGQLIVNTAGYGLSIKEGSNAMMGTATLSSGAVTVSTTAVLTGDRIFFQPVSNSGAGAYGAYYTYTITNATSFTVTSKGVLGATATGDNSTFNWIIIRPA